MLFVAEYSLGWDGLEAAAAKRLEWPEVRPETFRFVSEYIWHDGDTPFRGIAIIDVESVEDLHHFVLHYGSTVRMRIHPATDVMSGIETTMGAAETAPAKKAARPGAPGQPSKKKRRAKR
jgi:hypothetical protein